MTGFFRIIYMSTMYVLMQTRHRKEEHARDKGEHYVASERRMGDCTFALGSSFLEVCMLGFVLFLIYR